MPESWGRAAGLVDDFPTMRPATSREIPRSKMNGWEKMGWKMDGAALSTEEVPWSFQSRTSGLGLGMIWKSLYVLPKLCVPAGEENDCLSHMSRGRFTTFLSYKHKKESSTDLRKDTTARCVSWDVIFL